MAVKMITRKKAVRGKKTRKMQKGGASIGNVASARATSILWHFTSPAQQSSSKPTQQAWINYRNKASLHAKQNLPSTMRQKQQAWKAFQNAVSYQRQANQATKAAKAAKARRY